MNATERIRYAKEKYAAHFGINPALFSQKEHVFIESERHFFEVLCFGGGLIVLADPLLCDWCAEFFAGKEAKTAMSGADLYVIERKMRQFGKQLQGEHVCYLHLNPGVRARKPSGFRYELFEKGDMQRLFSLHPGFENALNYKDDVIALAAYNDDQIAALAGADDRVEGLWQIGIDTLSAYRQRGLAAYLTHELALQIENKGLQAFYTTWSANLASTRAALRAGFLPVWVGNSAQEDSIPKEAQSYTIENLKNQLCLSPNLYRSRRK
ncbi:MAG: GNAT family N-acetyltransferase [Christensenellaceae bacterium]|nr:GNAT family N-acetyltransferase [Christensenellaceae bacterium]